MPDTPLEWVEDLSKKLDARQSRVKLLDDYYRGRHKLAFTSAKFRKAFGARFDGFADNWCRPVVDVKAERLKIQGFKMAAEEDADPEAWKIWQANQLDAWSRIAHTEAMVAEQTYALVSPFEEVAPGVARITIEHPSQVIVAHAAGERRTRDGALKKWLDNSGYLMATLYLPDLIVRYRSEDKVKAGQTHNIKWVPRDDRFENPHSLQVVPVVPLPNRPGLLHDAESELVDVIPHQDSVNNLWANLLVAAEHHAVRRPWVIMAELPQDEQGKPVNPLENKDLDSIAIEGEGTVGSLDETDLKGFLSAIERVVQHIASQASVPPHYLNASADRLSGESIKAAETGLIARVMEKQDVFGEAWEETIRLAFRAVGSDQWADAVQAEVDWKDPESRTEASHADAVSKYVESLQLPRQRAWELIGESPQQIQRNLEMLAQEQVMFAGADIAALLDNEVTTT